MELDVVKNALDKMLINDNIKIYILDVFLDQIIKYDIVLGILKESSKDTLTKYMEDIKSKIQTPFLSGYMNLISIPKMKEALKEQKNRVEYKYQSLDSNWYKVISTLITIDNKDLIFLIEEKLEEKEQITKEYSNSKYNNLINNLADSLYKISNVFNLENKEKINIKNIEDYINSILNNLVNTYPELKKSLNKNVANITGASSDVLLIVDDDLITRNMIKKVFSDDYKIVMATNGKEAIEYLEANSNKGLLEESDNILSIFLDLTMPVMDGFAVLEYLSKNNYLHKIPVIIISGDYEKETKSRVYNYSIADMLEKPFDFEIVKHRIDKFINLYKSSNSLFNLINDEQKELKELLDNYIENYKYDYKDNIRRVNEYIKILGKKIVEDYPEYDLNEEKINKIADSSMYYDIGFNSIPKSILSKKELDEQSINKIKKYPLFGDKMLNYVLSFSDDSLYKKYASNITKYYHENYNGKGYPIGLVGNKIPVEAQIAAICIMYNNLFVKKENNVKDIIISKKNIMFNPNFVDSFVSVYEEFLNVK